MKTYYAFEFASIPVNQSASISKILPNNAKVTRLFIEAGQFGKFKVMVEDLDRQQVLGVMTSQMATSALNGFELDVNVSSQVKITVFNMDTAPIVPTVALQVNQ